MNVCLVRVSKFFRQFHLVDWHKSGKKHIILDTLNRPVNANDISYNASYSELNTMFVYYITLVKIKFKFIKYILKSYITNN